MRLSPTSLTKIAVLAGATAVWLVGPPHAIAQQVVARVNGEPISAVDLAQRTRLRQISGEKDTSRKAVLDELIDERLKMQVAQRYRVEITDAEVNRIVGNMATRMRANPDQFAGALAAAGVSIHALKRKLRADLAWNNVVRGKFQASLQIREKDIELAAQARAGGEAKSNNLYTLRPILLVVPRGSGDNVFMARRREAEGLRTRFQNCEDGLRLARGLRDVAVREPIIRGAGDLSAKQRQVLEATPVGRLTPPDITPSGVEVFAVCEKKAGKGSSGAERDVREELFGAQFDAKGKEYLAQLRRSAKIEIR